MSETWYGPAIKTDTCPESQLGHYTGGAPKGGLHTTESWTGKVYAYAPALGVYRSKGYWPQFTHTIERGFFETYQHIPIDRPGKAFEHPSGTGDTNNDNVVQAEICWGANHAADMPDIMIEGLAPWMRWVEANHGVARIAPLPFVTGANRPSWQFWHDTSGWYGHQHVPANSHVDPGPIPIARLLGKQPGPTPQPTPEDDMAVLCSNKGGGPGYITNQINDIRTLVDYDERNFWLSKGVKDIGVVPDAYILAIDKAP